MTFEQFKQNSMDRISSISLALILAGDFKGLTDLTNLVTPPIAGNIGGLTISESLDKIEFQLSENESNSEILNTVYPDFTPLFNVDFSKMTGLEIKETIEGISAQIISGSKI